MELKAAIRGRLDEVMAAERAAVSRGVTDGVTEATDATKARLRAAVRGAFVTRKRPGNAIRGKVYRNRGHDAAGVVFSKLGTKRGGRWVDYVAVHAAGATITDRDGYMLIPTKGVSRRLDKARRSLDRLGSDPKLKLIPTKGGYLFVRETRTRATLIARLVKKVVLKQRVDLAAIERAAPRALADRVGKALAREPARGSGR